MPLSHSSSYIILSHCFHSLSDWDSVSPDCFCVWTGRDYSVNWCIWATVWWTRTNDVPSQTRLHDTVLSCWISTVFILTHRSSGTSYIFPSNVNVLTELLSFSQRKPPDWCLLYMLNTLSLNAGKCRFWNYWDFFFFFFYVVVVPAFVC